MPSLRQRMTTYFRQLSFIAEPREDSRLAASLSPRHRQDDGCFITRYLEGQITKSTTTETEISNGKEPIDLPELQLKTYETGPNEITAACTGPDEGLTGVKRSRLHLSAGPDIDFIDTNLEPDFDIRKSSISSIGKQKQNFQKFKADQNANKPFQRSRKVISKEQKKSETDVAEPKIEKATINVIVSMISTTTLPTSLETNKQTLEKSITLTDNINKNISVNVEEGPSLRKLKEDNDVVNELLGSREFHTMEVLEPIAGVTNWKLENDHAYGLSVSLYEKNFLTNEQAGNPIADCYGVIVRGNSSAMAMADGVNWGEGARLAARSAIQGSLEYLDTAIFGQVPGGMATTTREVFVSLLRSFWEAHACILEVGGALSTLTVAVVLPLSDKHDSKYVVCACNVGDSLGYVYSKVHGVREFTQGSHDITSMRDMRDALGALGPVDGNKPELSNLTLSMTIVEFGDIVFLTSDGISDNFDPVVGKFAEPFTTEALLKTTQSQKDEIRPQLASKRQNKSASAIQQSSVGTRDNLSSKNRFSLQTNLPKTNFNNQKPKSIESTSTGMPPIRPSRTKKITINTSQTSSASASSSAPPQTTKQQTNIPTITNRPKFLRSQTVMEPRNNKVTKSPTINFPKSVNGLPLVTGPQRHTLTLLRLEDLLCYGINGTTRPCPSARKLCHLLIDFAKMITSAKRNILEQRELYYRTTTDHAGVRREIELNKLQQRAARKRIVDGPTFSSLPGKLDHASVVAFTIGSDIKRCSESNNKNFNETDF